MRRNLRIRFLFLSLFFVFSAYAQEPVKGPGTLNPNRPSGIPEYLQEARIFEKLGAEVELGAIALKDESGAQVKLASFFHRGKPVVLVPVYYECPNLCTLVLNGLVQLLKSSDWVPGGKFEVVVVSMNHRETPELASRKKEAYLKEYGKPETAEGWHFLVGSEPMVRKLFDQVGFGFKYDEKAEEYAHSAALIVLTPEGKVSRYLYGVQFEPKDFKLALLEASNGKIGTLVDRVLLFCYGYDPNSRGYALQAMRVMRLAGLVTLVFVGMYLFVFWSRQRRKNRAIKKEHQK